MHLIYKNIIEFQSIPYFYNKTVRNELSIFMEESDKNILSKSPIKPVRRF